MLNVDLNKVPKQFCSNVSMGFNKENFVLGLFNGEAGSFYALTPQHIKRLEQYIAHQVKQYEENFGEINAKWEPGIISPIQTNANQK